MCSALKRQDAGHQPWAILRAIGQRVVDDAGISAVQLWLSDQWSIGLAGQIPVSTGQLQTNTTSNVKNIRVATISFAKLTTQINIIAMNKNCHNNECEDNYVNVKINK